MAQQIKAPAKAWGELIFKVEVVQETEDLLDSYSLTADECDAIRKILLDSQKSLVLDSAQLSASALEMLSEEAEDASVVLADQADEAEPNSKEERQIKSFSTTMRKLSEALAKARA